MINILAVSHTRVVTHIFHGNFTNKKIPGKVTPVLLLLTFIFTSEETEAQKLAQGYNIGKCKAGSRTQIFSFPVYILSPTHMKVSFNYTEKIVTASLLWNTSHLKPESQLWKHHWSFSWPFVHNPFLWVCSTTPETAKSSPISKHYSPSTPQHAWATVPFFCSIL